MLPTSSADDPLVAKTRPTAAWIAVLCWCAICGWFAFAKSQRVPLLSLADLGFHELGHLILYIIPISQLLTAAMGSIMQCAVPLGLAAYFGYRRKDQLSMVACLAWASTNFQDVSVYIADAPYERLELIGGEHDWAYILGSDGLDRMHDAARLASNVRGLGVLVLLGAVAVAVVGLVRSTGPSAPEPVPDAATAATPGDLWQTTSRTQSSDPDRRSSRW
jgi:hypothetical protein